MYMLVLTILFRVSLDGGGGGVELKVDTLGQCHAMGATWESNVKSLRSEYRSRVFYTYECKKIK